MKSPFPGMDPYLESRWGDFHSRLAYLASTQLRPQLAGDLRARIEEDFVVETIGDSPNQRIKPDTSLAQTRAPRSGSQPVSSNSAVMEPLELRWAAGPSIQRSVRIVDVRNGDRLVTAIEFLSPTNKSTTKGRRAYRRKQKAILSAGASLVEVDLIRGGKYVLKVPSKVVPSDYQEIYRICVSRGWMEGRAQLYRIRLEESLPAIHIPLRKSEPDARLDIQQLLDEAYESGDYTDIQYSEEPDPPLKGDDATWADELLRKAGKR